MANLFNVIWDFFTENEGYDGEQTEEESFEEAAPRFYARTREEVESDEEETDSGETNMMMMPGRDMFRHRDYTPYCFDDMAAVVDYLKDKKAVILRMDELDTTFCQRVLDFISGAAYAMNCVTAMPSNDVCIIIPRDMDRALLLG